MSKNDWWRAFRIWLAFILFFLALTCMCSSCSLLPASSNPIITGPIPSAGQQLWKAAKDSNWLVTVSILGIAAGAFAFLNGSKIGLPCIGASCISLFMSLAVARFSTWMAIFGLIGSLAAVGISVLVKNRAVQEIVAGGQEFKKDLNSYPPAPRFNKIQSEIQSKSTKKLVQNVKSKLKLKGKI